MSLKWIHSRAVTECNWGLRNCVQLQVGPMEICMEINLNSLLVAGQDGQIVDMIILAASPDIVGNGDSVGCTLACGL